ncbi:MAG: WD40 repeat domain-containing protein [Planctomycetota bacterium]|nr:WD40 repeat domain-containing protein [Planctomycetota bacterium]
MTSFAQIAAAIFVILCAAVSTASHTNADDPAVIAPNEFETAPAVILHVSTDVLSVAVLQQREQILAALSNGRVMVLDRTTREPVQLVECHAGPVTGLDVSISGELLVTAGADGTVKTWHLPSFNLAATLPGTASRIAAVAISSDGSRIAASGFDKTIRLWNVESTADSSILNGNHSVVRSVAFSPDGTTLASASDDGMVRLWSVKQKNEIRTFSGHVGRIRDVEFSPDGRTVAAAGEDGVVLLWSVANPDASPMVLTHSAMIWCVAFSPRGSLLAAGDADGTVHIWDLETGRITSSLEGPADTVTSLRFTADSQTLYGSSHDGLIYAWRAKQPPYPAFAAVEIDAGKVWAMAVSPDGSQIAVGGHRGFFRTLDLKTGKQGSELHGSHPATVDCLEYSPDGQFIATGSWRNDTVMLWRADDGAKQQSFKADGNIRAIAFSPDGMTIAAGCDDKLLFVWNLESGEVIHKVNAHALPVYDVSYSPDGQTIATCSGNWTEAKPGQIKLWKADSLDEITRLEGHDVAIRSAVFSPDGSKLASVSEDGVIKVWDIKTQTELTTLRNSGGARPLDWSPDGRLLAAGLHDGTTNVWQLNSGVVIRRFGGNEDTFSVRFVPDGSVLCGVGGDARMTLWNTSELTGNGEAGRVVESVQNWAGVMP